MVKTSPMRLDAKSRRKMIVDAATRVADDIGIMRLTPENVAEACEISTSAATVRRYFLTMKDLRDEIMRLTPGR